MLTTVNVASYWKGVIKLNYKSAGGFVCGWSETIDIVAADEDAACVILRNYCNHRQWILPDTTTIVYGSVIKVPLARYSRALQDLPLTGKAPDLTTPNVLDMDSPERTFCLHMIVHEGKKSIRHIHGLPDDTISATSMVLAAPGGSWIDLTTASTPGTANPSTLAAAIKLFISFIGMNSYVASQPGTFSVDAVMTPNAYRMRAIQGLLSRDVRKRPVGRPFGLSRGRQPIH